MHCVGFDWFRVAWTHFSKGWRLPPPAEAGRFPPPRIMSDALQILLNVLRQAWGALTIFIISAGSLAMLAKTLTTLGASTIGARFVVWESLASLLAVIVLVLVAFVGIPPIVRAVATSIPGSPGCGPITELGTFASGLIAAIAGVRMVLAVARTIGGAAIGGMAEVSQALIEVVEALFGMLLAGIAIPLVAMFFTGGCTQYQLPGSGSPFWATPTP